MVQVDKISWLKCKGMTCPIYKEKDKRSLILYYKPKNNIFDKKDFYS